MTKIVQHKSRSNKRTLIWAAVGDGAATGALIGHVTTPEPPDEVLYQAP